MANFTKILIIIIVVVLTIFVFTFPTYKLGLILKPDNMTNVVNIYLVGLIFVLPFFLILIIILVCMRNFLIPYVISIINKDQLFTFAP
jgi:hypothetical protein